MVQNVNNITIQSSSPSSQATITCKAGFGFYNVSNLKLVRLTFHDCGGEIILPQSVEDATNKSNIFIGPYQRAVLFFTQCFDTQLQSVNIPGPYKGFGILFWNAMGKMTNLFDVNVTNNSFCQNDIYPHTNFSCVGSGIAFVYTNSYHPSEMSSINLNKVILNNNHQSSIFNSANRDLFGLWRKRTPLFSATGLTLIFSSNDNLLNISLRDVEVLHNVGIHCGAMLILFHRSSIVQNVLMSNINVSENLMIDSKYSGQALSSGVTFIISNDFKHHQGKGSFYSNIRIRNSKFMGNIGRRGAGILFISPLKANCEVNFTVESSDFVQNSGYGILFELSKLASEDTVSKFFVHLMNVQAYRNIYHSNIYTLTLRRNLHGVFQFTNVDSVILENCSIWNNLGSAVEITAGTIELVGEFHCEKNTGNNGGCLCLKGFSLLLLTKSTHAVFKENNALLSGGAIYGETSQVATEVCTIQPYEKTTLHRYPLVFDGNTASLDGNDIKIYNLYECSIFLNKSSQFSLEKHDFNLYQKLFQFLPKFSRKSLSGRETQLHFCHSANSRQQYYYYSGQTITLPMYATDLANFTVYAQVLASIHSHNKIHKAELLNDRYYNLYPDSCSNLSFTVTSKENSKFSASIQIQSSLDYDVGVTYEIQIYECPYGFNVSKASKNMCVCSPFLHSLNIACDIEQVVINLPLNAWFGTAIEFNGPEGFSSYCPNEYCHSHFSNYTNPSPNGLCRFNRTEIMCGRCKEGLSVVFGSEECQSCSNLWLLTIIMYALVCVFLVLVIFYIRLTVAGGLLGGLIFFANMSVVSLHTNLLDSCNFSRTIGIFLALLNLNLGYPMCFYNGMSNISRTALQFVVPVFLLCIVLGLVIISKYSTKVSNLIVNSSVQVLATLIQLSFGKLLLTVCEVLTSSTVMVSHNSTTSSYTVWYFDGNVLYFSGGHRFLLLASLFAVCLFILPYLLFTTTGSYLGRCSSIAHRLQPLVDAYHGPYKDKYRFWFGVRQWLMTLLYILYSTLRGTHPETMLMIKIIIISVFTIAQVILKPLKTSVMNFIDGWFLFLLYVMDLTTYFFLSMEHSESPPCCVAALVIICLYLLSVAIIFIYHIIMSTRRTKQAISNCTMLWKTKEYRGQNQHLHDDFDYSRMYESFEDYSQ